MQMMFLWYILEMNVIEEVGIDNDSVVAVMSDLFGLKSLFFRGFSWCWADCFVGSVRFVWLSVLYFDYEELSI